MLILGVKVAAKVFYFKHRRNGNFEKVMDAATCTGSVEPLTVMVDPETAVSLVISITWDGIERRKGRKRAMASVVHYLTRLICKNLSKNNGIDQRTT